MSRATCTCLNQTGVGCFLTFDFGGSNADLHPAKGQRPARPPSHLLTLPPRRPCLARWCLRAPKQPEPNNICSKLKCDLFTYTQTGRTSNTCRNIAGRHGLSPRGWLWNGLQTTIQACFCNGKLGSCARFEHADHMLKSAHRTEQQFLQL